MQGSPLYQCSTQKLFLNNDSMGDRAGNTIYTIAPMTFGV
jgi:hypothetical protein